MSDTEQMTTEDMYFQTRRLIEVECARLHALWQKEPDPAKRKVLRDTIFNLKAATPPP
jgi:hypothetical protein